MPIAPVVVPMSPIVAPAADPRARLAQLVDEMQRLRRVTNSAVHRAGVILRELSQPTMIAAAGVVDFDALLELHDLPSRMTAMKYMAIAEHFTEEEATQLGTERGYAIVRGAAALPQPIAPRLLLAQNPTITVGPLSARLAAAPLRTLVTWVKELSPSATPAPPRRMYKELDSVRDKLHRRFVAAGIGETKMRVVRRRGEYVVRVELSAEEAAALVQAVKKVP